MILRKVSAQGPWTADFVWPLSEHVRIHAMESLALNLERPGSNEREIIRLLALGVDDPNDLSIWFRDDRDGSYYQSKITPSVENYVRSMEVFFDEDTGEQSLFVGSRRGEIYRGRPFFAGNGRLDFVWTREPIIGRTTPTQNRRIMAITRADNVLYATFGPEGDEEGGLYRRSNGTSPEWNLVAALPFPGDAMPRPNPRGLTAFQDSDQPFTDKMLVAPTTDASIRRYELASTLSETIELDAKAFLEEAVADTQVAGGGLNAYNMFTEVVDPATGERLHLFGSLSNRVVSNEAATMAPDNGTYLIIRREDGSYHQDYVFDPENPPKNNESLRAVRTIAVSPFPEDEGRVIYLGGFDAGIDTSRTKSNTAWIYRATWQ